MNDHWLKERFKEFSTDLLEMSLVFDESKWIETELKRRVQETALIQEDTP